MWLKKFKYFLVHLFLSICVAVCFLGIVFYVWHPQPLAKAVGVTNIFFMMLIIDVILGPLLTLFIARKGKKTLKFDLLVIGIFQISALAYGMYNIIISRPVWIVFDTMRFELIQANNIPQQILKNAPVPYNYLGFLNPKWIAVKVAENEQEKSDRTFFELQTGISPSMQPTLYEPIIKQSQLIRKNSHDLNELKQYNPKMVVERILIEYPEANAWLPLKASEIDMVVLINKQKAKVVKIVDLRPWN
ncbi:TfpX/TfpZ family type IV pilin accessory protein [Acinetobacter sp. YH12072]|uniref:TfpX/TfpZ family type IV pilin accessory protein n=1 Tax=Acinetobacter sp. YH12072 TaxID=2601068 RepID=UPI0015D2AB55|nr:TfpX/TfpZ family type IV pilin accessory protein [Acinetobacter sp. YH12072]